MKKKIVFFTAVILTAVMFSACFSTPAGKPVFDPNLNKESAATIVFEHTVKVSEYNGISVGNEWYPNNTRRRNTVLLPAGSASIVFDFYVSLVTGYNRYTNVTLNGVELRFDFEAGKEYYIGYYSESVGSQTLFQSSYEVGIAIWSGTSSSNRKDNALRFWKFGET